MAKAVKKQQQAPVVVKGYVPTLQKKYREDFINPIIVPVKKGS